jgi:hypothetical protein
MPPSGCGACGAKGSWRELTLAQAIPFGRGFQRAECPGFEPAGSDSGEAGIHCVESVAAVVILEGVGVSAYGEVTGSCR